MLVRVLQFIVVLDAEFCPTAAAPAVLLCCWCCLHGRDLSWNAPSQVMTPRVRDDETWSDFVPHLPKHRDDDDGSMEARYKAGHQQDIEVSYNRKPEWNEKLKRFELDIKNRAQLPSTKNFMISTRSVILPVHLFGFA